MERDEITFAFPERLRRLRSVRATDHEQCRLVLTRAGAARATDALLQKLGANVRWVSAIASIALRARDAAEVALQRAPHRTGDFLDGVFGDVGDGGGGKVVHGGRAGDRCIPGA